MKYHLTNIPPWGILFLSEQIPHGGIRRRISIRAAGLSPAAAGMVLLAPGFLAAKTPTKITNKVVSDWC